MRGKVVQTPIMGEQPLSDVQIWRPKVTSKGRFKCDYHMWHSMFFFREKIGFSYFTWKIFSQCLHSMFCSFKSLRPCCSRQYKAKVFTEQWLWSAIVFRCTAHKYSHLVIHKQSNNYESIAGQTFCDRQTHLHLLQCISYTIKKSRCILLLVYSAISF